MSKNELLEKARDLRKSTHRRVFIVQEDQTPKERQARKTLVDMRDQRRLAGEDVVIWQGKIVPRRVKPGD